MVTTTKQRGLDSFFEEFYTPQEEYWINDQDCLILKEKEDELLMALMTEDDTTASTYSGFVQVMANLAPDPSYRKMLEHGIDICNTLTSAYTMNTVNQEPVPLNRETLYLPKHINPEATVKEALEYLRDITRRVFARYPYLAIVQFIQNESLFSKYLTPAISLHNTEAEVYMAVAEVYREHFSDTKGDIIAEAMLSIAHTAEIRGWSSVKDWSVLEDVDQWLDKSWDDVEKPIAALYVATLGR